MEQEIVVRGDEVVATTRYDTDDEERYNWASVQAGKGFVRDGRGNVEGRVVANIPAPDAARLEAEYDLDWMAFSRNDDRAAFRRLLGRFPYWKACGGGV